MKILLIGILFITKTIYSQDLILLTDNSLKLGATEEQSFYYGFAKGDELVFDFEVLKGKQLKEIEISEINSSTLFMGYESREIENKRIKIPTTGIYKIRFYNPTLVGRVCSFRISRLPSAGMEQFNSTVFWKTISDTTFQTVEERYLVNRDTTIVNVLDQVAKVHSVGNLNGNKNYFNFELPPNTVSWSYYLGVDQAGQKAYENAASELTNLSKPLSRLAGFSPGAAIALGLAPMIATLQAGEDVNFYIVEGDENAKLFNSGQQFYCIKKGLIINTFSQMPPNRNTLFVCLHNDNAITGISVAVKITAITVKENWDTREIQKMKVTFRQVAYLN